MNGGIQSIRGDPEGRIWIAVERAGIERYVPSVDPPDTVIQQISSRVPSGDRNVFQFDGYDPWEVTPKDALRFSWRIQSARGKTVFPWSAFEEDRIKVSPKLRAGNYIFEVRAADTDFNFDPTPAQAAFTVLPPLWATAGFL